MTEFGKKIKLDSILVWRRTSDYGNDWELTDEGRVFAEISINRRRFEENSGVYSNHEFTMEKLKPQIPSSRRNRREYRAEYAIKIKNLKDETVENGIEDFGHLIFGMGANFSPTSFIANGDRKFDIFCHHTHDREEYSFVSSNPDDKGRVISYTKRAGKKIRENSMFQLVSLNEKDPPPMLVALMCFCFSSIVYYKFYYGL